MSDINCNFDMPQSVPLRDLNTKCYGEDVVGQLLGLRGRFESEEVTATFVEQLLALSPADQKKVMIRFTDKAMRTLYAHAESYQEGKEKTLLMSLYETYKNPAKRIVEEGRKFVLAEQTSRPDKQSMFEWGDGFLQTMLAEAFMAQQCVPGATWCYG